MYTPDRCRESFLKVKEYAEEAGRTLPQNYVWAVFIYTALYDDVAEAREKAVAEMSYRYDQDFDPLVDKYAAYGPPDRLAARLAEFIDAGVNYFILAPIMPPMERSQHLQRMAEEVLPALEKMTPGKIL